MKNILLMSFFLTLFACTQNKNKDTFFPLKNGVAPQNFEELWKDYDPVFISVEKYTSILIQKYTIFLKKIGSSDRDVFQISFFHFPNSLRVSLKR